MRNSWKVARWEIRKNLKNKSFLISLFLTPAIFVIAMSIPILFGMFADRSESSTLYVTDEIGLWNEQVEQQWMQTGDWSVVLNPDDEQAVLSALEQEENVYYLVLTEEALQQGTITFYMHVDGDEDAVRSVRMLEQPLKERQIQAFNLPDDLASALMQGVQTDVIKLDDVEEGAVGSGEAAESGQDPLRRIVPAAFAGLILFSVVITGMMIFQSASQEKKEKVSEMILSSITPSQLMEGKIIGYFVLGMVQVALWIVIALPIVIWQFGFEMIGYLLVPETLLLMLFAIGGYLMFAALFVGLGATVEDMATSGNFQGIVFMIPWIPFMLFAPVMSNPEGIVAQVASVFPLTAPGIMLLRLSMLDSWPWWEILLSIAVLGISIWLLMKLAGKIFKTGILMYGKNATPMEIWRWLKH